MNPVAHELYERIRREGAVDGQVIKVDRFLNHMVDPVLIDKLGAELCAAALPNARSTRSLPRRAAAS